MTDGESSRPGPNADNDAGKNQGSASDDASETQAGERSPRRSASQDLAEGLELMLRAAKKAFGGVEHLNRKKVEDLGRKAAKNLDPRRIEDIAEDAGRELLRVVERVADRIESAIGSTRPGADSESTSTQDENEERPRVRVKDDDSKS